MQKNEPTSRKLETVHRNQLTYTTYVPEILFDTYPIAERAAKGRPGSE